MSPTDQDTIKQQIAAQVVTPAIHYADIVGMADQPNAAADVAMNAHHLMQSVNNITVITNQVPAVREWKASNVQEFARLSSHKDGADSFSVDFTREVIFNLARVYDFIAFSLLAAALFGVAVLLNTVSATISGSGEIASLTGDRLGSMMFGTLPLLGMLIIHVMHYSIMRDSVKRRLLFILIAIVLACAVTWVVMFAYAFPVDGLPQAVDDNLFAATATNTRSFDALRWLIIVQFVGEITAGGVVGIALEHFRTRGKKAVVTANVARDEIDLRQRELLHEIVQADRLLGSIEDFQRRYQSAEAVFVQRCLSFLREIENDLTTARSAAYRDLVQKYRNLPSLME